MVKYIKWSKTICLVRRSCPWRGRVDPLGSDVAVDSDVAPCGGFPRPGRAGGCVGWGLGPGLITYLERLNLWLLSLLGVFTV